MTTDSVMRARVVTCVIWLTLAPWCAFAQSENFSIATEPQTIAPGAISGAITISAASPVGQTTCVLLASNSGTGQFSSSASNWSTVSAVTMSKNTSNRTLYYKDTTSGSYTLSIRIAPKPDTVSASCASWEDAQAAAQETLTQTITISSSHTEESTPPPQETPPPPATSGNTSGGTVSSYVPPPQPQIFAYAGKDRDVVAGADAPFEATAYDRKGTMLDNKTVRFSWTFGDGATAEGSSVKHRFAVPGRYVVVLNIAQALSSASHHVIVTARPVSVAVSVQGGNIAVHNTSGRDIDLSDWFLRTSTGLFRIPPSTILLSGERVVFAQEITRLALSSSEDAALLYPNGVVAMGAGAPLSAPNVAEGDNPTSPIVSAPEVLPASVRGFVADDAGDDAVPIPETTVSATMTTEVASAAASGTLIPWWLAAGAVSLFGAFAAWALRRPTDRWRIIEETPESGYSKQYE